MPGIACSLSAWPHVTDAAARHSMLIAMIAFMQPRYPGCRAKEIANPDCSQTRTPRLKSVPVGPAQRMEIRWTGQAADSAGSYLRSVQRLGRLPSLVFSAISGLAPLSAPRGGGGFLLFLV